MNAAVGVRIGRKNSTAREARHAAWWHIDNGLWLTNNRYDALQPGVPVLASACGTWWFLRGTVVDEPSDWDGDFRFAYPVHFEPTVYLGDPSNPVLKHIGTYVRNVKALTEDEYRRGLAGLRPDEKATR